MASVGAMESSIASASPASSPPSTPPDPIDEAPPRLKNAWSQIVRGSSTPARSKVEPSPSNLQPEEQNERPHPHHLSPDAHSRVSATLQEQHQFADSMIKENPSSDTHAAVVKSSPISSSDSICSPCVERKQVACDVPLEMPTASSDKLSNESASSENKPTQQSPVKSPKPVWGKLASNAGFNPEPEPVMGAVAWPALSEARNTKASEPSKTTASQKITPKSSPISGDRHHLQAPPLLNREVGGTHQSMSSVTSQKPFNQIIGNGNKLPETILTDTASSNKGVHAIDADQLKRSGGRETRVVAASEGHQRGNAASQVSSHEGPRSLMWDQGRGNHSFPGYGRGYANAPRETNVPAHHQRVGHRNLPQPFVPFVPPNPGFVHPAGFQNVPGSMYYIPAPSSDTMLGATYFAPPAVQGVLMHGPDPITLQALVMKQIEYYFSVENLCRDIYLRSKMDERGFVPVSVIANFNRVRMITQNPFLIIEALRMSNVVEVQGDKVRKKGDWANWLLPASQQSPGFSSPVGEGDQNIKFSQSSQKAEEADHQSNGVDSSKVAAQGGENSEAHIDEKMSDSHLVSKMNVQTVVEDPLQHEVDSLNVGRVGNSSLDEEIESEHFSQSCSVESVHGVE